MALDPSSGRRSVSPESSGRESPAPRKWRNQLGTKEPPHKDKHYRKYASGVDRTLSLFDTTLQEWADYISFLNRLLKALQARPSDASTIPSKATVAKRLSQCLNPSLPSGVHQKALELYSYVFSVIGSEGLSDDLPLYLPGLSSTLSFASLAVRTLFLDLMERYFLQLRPAALRLAAKAIILMLLPGLEEETSEDFERTLALLESFKVAVRPGSSQELSEHHATGDAFFWQCFFLATITSQTRRTGALAYLVRSLPKLGTSGPSQRSSGSQYSAELEALVTTPEPGLLLRCFAAGLSDEQLLVQRGYLDLLVTHLPLDAEVLQTKAKPEDLELLLKSAAGVVIRRDMSLNRRLWSWMLGPDPPASEIEGPESPDINTGTPILEPRSKTGYFEEFGLHPLTQSLLRMIRSSPDSQSPAERARPYRVCLSLMDRWEIGGLVVPEVFLPIVDSVRKFKATCASKSDFAEVLRSASVFFDGVESGLIYSELLSLIAQAIGPGDATADEREDKLALAKFILSHFNVREEEMITVHAPLTALAILCMLEDAKNKEWSGNVPKAAASRLSNLALALAGDLLDFVAPRAFSLVSGVKPVSRSDSGVIAGLPSIELLKKIKHFYVADQGNLDLSRPPLDPRMLGQLLLQRAVTLVCDGASDGDSTATMSTKARILVLLFTKTPLDCVMDADRLYRSIADRLSNPSPLPFTTLASFLQLATQACTAERFSHAQLSELTPPIVGHAWSFLAASEPRHHVETARSLWQLQTALGYESHEIEAAVCSLMMEGVVRATYPHRSAESGRTFSILWTHTLQDSSSGADRKPRTPNGDARGAPRLYGADNYTIMLTRPLFIMLDALSDERTQLFIAVKGWLNSLVGTEQLVRILLLKLVGLPYIGGHSTPASGTPSQKPSQDGEQDYDTGSYYIQTFCNILRWSPNHIWEILAAKTLSHGDFPALSSLIGSDTAPSFQEVLVRICRGILEQETASADDHPTDSLTHLHRSALTLMHQILLNPYAEKLSGLQLENSLIERLSHSLEWSDPYLQILLLDVVFASLKLREILPLDLPTSPGPEKRPRTMSTNVEPSRTLRGSIGSDKATRQSINIGPPPTLLKCLQAGLSAPSSQAVLESWISFLIECLPLYSDTIFQVLIPLVETLCAQIGRTFGALQETFAGEDATDVPDQGAGPESALISLLNGLEQVLARGHDRLLAEEARVQAVKGPDQQPGFFGNMVSGVFSSDAPQTRSATANDRLTVLLAFQDAVRICFKIWSWGQRSTHNTTPQDSTSFASFTYTSLRMRNRARRLLEHLFAAETLECLETVMGIWKASITSAKDGDVSRQDEVFNILPALDGSRPKHTIPAIFDAIYSRTNPTALDPSRKSTLTISLQDTDVVIFLVDYARTLEDDAMDEIWSDCITFLKDLLSNPFPHRQILPSLLEFTCILGEKVDNTNFGEQRKMRRELGDLFLRLLAALFTTRPMTFADTAATGSVSEKSRSQLSRQSTKMTLAEPSERADDVVGILAAIVPSLPKVLLETDKVLNAASTISANVIGPALRSKAYPETVSQSTLLLLQELSRLPNNQKTWKKDVSDAFNDSRFFGSDLVLVQHDWLPLLRQWAATDKDRMTDILGRIASPTTAGIVFGVGATSARLEADRKTQLNLRRVATLVLASTADAFVADLSTITEKVVELLTATSTSSPSSTTRAEVYMLLRALVLRTSTVHLAPLWPIINTELHAAISSVVAPDHSTESDTFNNLSVLQACKLLDLLVCVAPDDFQLHEWLFVTDTIDAVYRPAAFQPVALADELSEELGSAMTSTQNHGTAELAATVAASGAKRRLLLGPHGISDEVTVERRDELVAKILRPFFGQLSIFAFESTYAMAPVDLEGCVQSLLRDLFDERNIVKAL